MKIIPTPSSILPGTIAAILAIASIIAGPLQARTTDVYASPLDQESLDQRLMEVLSKLDPVGPNEEEDTAGFRHRYSSSWLSPYSYDLYTGPITSQIPRSIIRIEAAEGDAAILSRVLLQEQLIPEDALLPSAIPAQKPGYKSHLISQGLNLVAPWVGIWYNGYRTPRLTSSQTWFRFMAYFLADAILVSAAGSNWYQESFDASEYGSRIAAALALTRVVGSWQSYHTISGHNHLVELKYTFHFE